MNRLKKLYNSICVSFHSFKHAFIYLQIHSEVILFVYDYNIFTYAQTNSNMNCIFSYIFIYVEFYLSMISSSFYFI